VQKASTLPLKPQLVANIFKLKSLPALVEEPGWCFSANPSKDESNKADVAEVVALINFLLLSVISLVCEITMDAKLTID
jgi:hypothetical protein